MRKIISLILILATLVGAFALQSIAVADSVTDFDIDFFGFPDNTLTMEVGRKYRLCPVFYPLGSTGTVEYEEERPSIANVDADGQIIAVSHGTTKITATCNGIQKEFTVVVNVSQPAYDASKAVVPGTPDFLGTSERDEGYTPPQTMSIGNRDYELSFFDDFKGDTLKNEWSYIPEWQRKNKPGWFRDAAAYLDGEGLLYIDNYVTEFDPNSSGADKFTGIDYAFASGAVWTKKGWDGQSGFEQAYGYWEICCAVPRVTGYWPSFWLLNDNMGLNDDGGRYGCEIDIFEAFANANSITHTIHWNGYGNTKNIYGAKSCSDFFSNGFHTVGLEWTLDQYIFYIDGYETWRSNQGTSDPDYPLMNICEEGLYLILCCEFGDSAGDDQFDLYPSAYLADYVRVYNLKEQHGAVSDEKEVYNKGNVAPTSASVTATDITLNCEDEITIGVGQTVQIYGEKYPVNATLDTTRGKLKYATCDSKVASINNSTCAVTGVSPGKSVITLTANKAGTLTKQVTVNVVDGTVEPPTQFAKGDVSGNGRVGAEDALMMFKYTSGTLDSLPVVEAAELTGDGKIDIADAMKLFGFVSGKISAL